MQTDAIHNQFIQHFGSPPDVIIRSPGRVNLIGEHTDYNAGWVLPAALDLGTLVAARRRPDTLLHTVAKRMNSHDTADLAALDPQAGPQWARYVRGVAALLDLEQGADLLIDGDLPLGAGLSSSASLEMGVAVALLSLAGRAIDPVALARLGQRVENKIIGVQSGIMDQLAVTSGVAHHALLIDCRTLDIVPVAVPANVRIVVFDSAVPRTLAGSAYNQRRAECESALRKLQHVHPQVYALCDVSPALLASEQARLTAVEQRRVRHVVSENQRVLECVAALRNGDMVKAGQLMHESHISLRDDYEVSGPELDALVDGALAASGVFGARLTGAGFGGCVVALVDASAAPVVADTVTEGYRAATERAGTAYVCTPAAGVGIAAL